MSEHWDIERVDFKSPFNSPRDPAQPPYHLRNGVAERAEVDRHESEHRRRLGMMPVANVDPPINQRERFDTWVTSTFNGTVDDDCIETMWLAWQAAQR